jgi:hypothetical protein
MGQMAAKQFPNISPSRVIQGNLILGHADNLRQGDPASQSAPQ